MLMFCTPPATTTSCVPLITPCAAKCTACWLEPHWRSIVVPGHLLGQPGREPARCGRCRRPAGRSCRGSRRPRPRPRPGRRRCARRACVIGVGAEVGRVHLAQAAAALADGRADGVDDVGLGHGGAPSSDVGRVLAEDRGRADRGSRCQAASPQLPQPAPTPASSTGAGRARRSSRSRRGTAAPGGRRARAASAAGPWPSSTCSAASGSPVASEYAARYTSGAGELERERTSARWCLTAWNEPIGTPNCLRSRHVLDGHVEHRGRPSPTAAPRSPSAPRSNAWRQRRRRVELGQHVAGAGVPVDRNRRRLPSTDALGGRARRAGAARREQPSSASSQHERRRVGVGHERRRRAAVDRDRSPTTGSRAPAGRSPAIGQQRRGHRDVLDERLGQRGRPGSSAAARGRARSSPSPPSASGDQHAEHAHLAERVPQLGQLRPSSFVPRGAHRPRAGTPWPAGRATASRNASWSSVKAKRTAAYFLGQPEHALGDDVALDLVGARVDRARQRELVALHPRRRPSSSAVGPEQARARSRAGARRARTRRSW